ncbi:MAG: ABC transporter permease [Gemmataceae bacterium]|nr:ABC transporter permease [Gemmataceae bacterium]
MLAADLSFTTPGHLWQALASREIQYAVKLSLVSCSITTILSLWVGVPLGYLLSRQQVPGKWLVEAIIDIPIVLPPLVVGLSLLILFMTPPGRALENVTRSHMGFVLAFIVLPLALGPGLLLAIKIVFAALGEAFPISGAIAWPMAIGIGVVTVFLLAATGLGGILEPWCQRHFGTSITYAIPSVILAQFSVSCAFAVRTMRVTFDQINPRAEQVALTLGCSRSQAFWMVVLPEAKRGLLTAATLAWARALGEFGPILVFSGATRMKTEVLSTTVFLELSIGNIEAAVAVSLIMVLAALVVLVIVRLFGVRDARVL